MGGNDCDEELQDGEDGKHSQTAPAHILGIKNPQLRQAENSRIEEGRGPRARITCLRSHSQLAAELEPEPVLLLPVLCPPSLCQAVSLFPPSPCLGQRHGVNTLLGLMGLAGPANAKALATWYCKLRPSPPSGYGSTVLHVSLHVSHCRGCLQTHPVSDTKIHEQNGRPGKGRHGTENVHPQAAPHLHEGETGGKGGEGRGRRKREDQKPKPPTPSPPTPGVVAPDSSSC